MRLAQSAISTDEHRRRIIDMIKVLLENTHNKFSLMLLTIQFIRTQWKTQKTIRI